MGGRVAILSASEYKSLAIDGMEDLGS